MKKAPDEKLSQREIAEREKRTLSHFLTTKPELHKPLGKNPQAKRRQKEKRAK
jgi:hypothetical protein